MSVFVKLGDTTSPNVKVDLAVFERVTRNEFPWVQLDEQRQKLVKYGRCPECDNAMILVGIDSSNAAKTPHGRHRLKMVPGFSYNLERILGCPLLDSRKKASLSDLNSELTVEAIELRQFLIDHFDLVVGMFAEETGILPSRKRLRMMLDLYLRGNWYRWKLASKGSLPWLFGRVTYNFDLYGQAVAERSATRNAILSKVPSASFAEGRLMRDGPDMVSVAFGLREHSVQTSQSGARAETIIFFVYRKDVADASKATVLEKTLHLRPETFLKRVAHRNEPSRYGASLLEIAQQALADYLRDYPDARTAKVSPQSRSGREGDS